MSVPGNLVHTTTIDLRWGDMDANGHTNNTLFFRFFEEARIQWLGSINLSDMTAPQGPVIIKTSATFLQELNYPATIEVRTYADKAGNSSLDTYHLLVDKATGETVAEGYAKIVWFDRGTRKSCPLPDQLRALASNA